jgi:hypothetical protein
VLDEIERQWDGATDYDIVVNLIKGEMEYCLKIMADLECRRADSKAAGKFDEHAEDLYNERISSWFGRLATLQKYYPEMLEKAKELGLTTSEDEDDLPAIIDATGVTITLNPGTAPAQIIDALPPAVLPCEGDE